MSDLWRNMERAAAEKLARREIARKVDARRYKRPHIADVMKVDGSARLAEIPEDTRTLTQRFCGDPIPNDPRRGAR